MTNTPPASKGIQIPQYVVLLAVLFTALGALLMASTGVDRRSLVRAEFTLTPSLTFTPSITPTPVDPFANLSYTTWTSADNLISMDVPAAWTAQSSPQRPVDTSFTAEGAPETGLRVLALPISALGIPELAANAPVDAVARAIFADVQPPVEPRAVEAGELKGVAVKQTQQVPDQVTGQTRSLDADIWVLSLDETHIAVIQAVALTADWPKMEPILARAASSIKFDVAGTVKLLDEQFGLSAATATGEATAAATTEATAAATDAATVESTAAPTQEPTLEATPTATLAPTAVPTEAPTQVPTAVPTSPNTPSYTPTPIFTVAPRNP
ncbi:MAG: hypothetical protein OHK0023_19720 [Anaerolineae bacterium]